MPTPCCRAAARIAPLEPQDLVRLATAAQLVGRDVESAEVWEVLSTLARRPPFYAETGPWW